VSRKPKQERGKDEEEGPSFEKALERLEEIAERLEGGDLPLEEAIALAEEGQRLVQTCAKQLTEAEGRIQKLVEQAGTAALEPLEMEEEEAEESA